MSVLGRFEDDDEDEFDFRRSNLFGATSSWIIRMSVCTSVSRIRLPTISRMSRYVICVDLSSHSLIN